MPDADVTVNDLVLGDVTIKAAELEDFVIVKSDGGPTFHFANIVDDATMQVTHVLRAQEHLMNTPKHVAMFDALSIPRPLYAHIPLIFNPDSTKMSKRDKAKAARAAALVWLNQNAKDTAKLLALVKSKTSVDLAPTDLQAFLDKKSDDNAIGMPLARALGVCLPEIDVYDFRRSGYLPAVILNYISLLGWSAGNDIERFDLDFFVKNFDLDRIGKSNAKFDRVKLLAFNSEAVAKLSPEEFFAKWKAHLAAFYPDFLAKFDDARLRVLAESYRPRSKTLDEAAVNGKFFVLADNAVEFDAKAVKKVLHANDSAGLKTLAELRTLLAGTEPFDAPTIHNALESYSATSGKGLGDVAQPLRVAVSGSTVSPPINDTLGVLGKAATLARIDRCLAQNSTPVA
jgi:glutamyl-tRNA synthetase